MTDSDAVVLPEGVELGNPTVVVLPKTGFAWPVAAGSHRDPDLVYSDGRMDSTTRPEGLDMLQDNNEAIMVRAVGSGAPCFLSGWAEGPEVEFMIATRCQVTILATLVFERMCASDPRVQSRLRLCGRHLILAESSPLMVRGELEMTCFSGIEL